MKIKAGLTRGHLNQLVFLFWTELQHRCQNWDQLHALTAALQCQKLYTLMSPWRRHLQTMCSTLLCTGTIYTSTLSTFLQWC